jgi:hypothetical protein
MPSAHAAGVSTKGSSGDGLAIVRVIHDRYWDTLHKRMISRMGTHSY